MWNYCYALMAFILRRNWLEHSVCLRRLCDPAFEFWSTILCLSFLHGVAKSTSLHFELNLVQLECVIYADYLKDSRLC